MTESAELAIEGKTMVIEGVDMQGKGLQMLGRMRLNDGRQSGAFYAKLHHLSAAVSIENGKRNWKLVNAREWYEALPRGSESR